MSAIRPVVQVITAHRQREGGGFVVRRPLPTRGLDLLDPFLLIDEMGPVEYGPGEAIGAPDHPHRGFETVTYILEGSGFHEDSAGNQGHIGPGDVQWMTAGAGVVHSEMPGAAIRENGGRVHGFQIWVNLPKAKKMIPPAYQDLRAADIPTVTSADGKATAVIVAGDALGVQGSASTHTPILYQDWTVQPGAEPVDVDVPEDFNAAVYVFGGAVRIGDQRLEDGQLAVLGFGDVVRIEGTDATARFLLLAGDPIGEPVARYGPFVMNTPGEIKQAFLDYQMGRMGRITR